MTIVTQMSRPITTIILALGMAIPVQAQKCPHTSLTYTPRASNGALLSVGEIEAMRAQLPEIVGVRVSVASSAAPALVFSADECVVDVEDVTLVHQGMRMRLWFNIQLPQGHAVWIAGLPFQNGEFVFDRTGVKTVVPMGVLPETARPSSWKPVIEMGRTPGTTPPARDCPAALAVRDGLLLLPIWARRQAPEQRRECLAYLLGVLIDTTKRDLRELAAGGVNTMAAYYLVDDAAVLEPLIACVARHLDPVATTCNLALNTLTRQSYGYHFFARFPDSPPLTAENQQHVVDDWRAYASRSGGYAIFDAYLLDESLRAAREVMTALRAAIGATMPSHVILTHLDQQFNPTGWSGLHWESIVYFGPREARPGWESAMANAWLPGTPLRELRFQLLRSGIPRPATANPSTFDASRLSAEEATYREDFPNLDLAFRLRLVTTDDTLRGAAERGVREALAGLRAADSMARRARGRLSLSAVRARCATFVARGPLGAPPPPDCKVTALDSLGTVDGGGFHYAIYCILWSYGSPDNGTTCDGETLNGRNHRARGVAVFSRGDGDEIPRIEFERAATNSDLTFQTPAIVRNAAGTMLYVPIAMDGTGAFNSSEYFVRAGGRWEKIDSESWTKDVPSRLPPGRAILKGIWPDPVTLRATNGLYRPGDGNCCPTGGTAQIQLAIRGRRFELESVQVLPPRTR